MKKKTINFIKKTSLFFTLIAFLSLILVFAYSFFYTSRSISSTAGKENTDENCMYHVMVTGTYENKTFLEEVYKGALSLAEKYNCIVELHVPQTLAGKSSLQELLNYCSYLTCDGIIAYIDSQDETPILLCREDEPEIPLVTIGQLSPNLHQISYIGINNWELGKKLADETASFLKNGGNAYIISNSTALNSNNMISSLQLALQNYNSIHSYVLEKFDPSLEFSNKNNIFICLNEEDTILMAQVLLEQFVDNKYKLIGFGNNEVCHLYLQKGYISELISQNPEKIGESAIEELFEYRTKGYANSYITADVKISRSPG